MPVNHTVLQINVDQAGGGSWESSTYNDALGYPIDWHGASVRYGGTDVQELYQAAAGGRIYQMETEDTDDEGARIPFRFVTKKFLLDAVCMAHSVFTRLDAVDDEATLRVLMGGSEYGGVEQTYTLDLAATSGEIRTRLHRTLLGRWIQLEYSGGALYRPAVREVVVRCIPVRAARVSL